MKLTTKMGLAQWAIIILTGITSGVHFYLFAAYGQVIMLLNCLGFLGLLAIYFVRFDFLPVPRKYIRWAFMGYALLTIAAYIQARLASGAGFTDPVGLFTKAVEIVLIVLLWREQ